MLGRGGDSTSPHTFRSVWGERTHTEIRKEERGIPGEPVFNNPPSNAGDAGSIPGQGTKCPGEQISIFSKQESFFPDAFL